MSKSDNRPAHDGGEAVGAYLRLLREAAGITVAETANKVGIDTSQIWRIESGKTDCRGSILFKFIVVVGGDPGDVARLINNSRATKADGETLARLRLALLK